MIANGGVLLAGGGSYLLVSRLPDIIVGGIIASLLNSSIARRLCMALLRIVGQPGEF